MRRMKKIVILVTKTNMKKLDWKDKEVVYAVASAPATIAAKEADLSIFSFMTFFVSASQLDTLCGLYSVLRNFNLKLK